MTRDAQPSAAGCPQCGATLAPASAGELCARCLMRMAMTPQAKTPSATPPALTPEQLAPRFPQYEIQVLLGRGGMGAVYRARHRKLDRLVAIKVLLPDLDGDPEFAERFVREARAMARLTHPGIVGVHDFGDVDGYFYLVLEYVDGASLRELLANGRLTGKDVLALIPQICDALQFAHDHGIVHRDIKPENILIDQDGRARIADFGLAKIARVEGVSIGLTRTDQAMGTPHYMAPEQVIGAGAVDHRADIYSLGVVLYEMLTGELPLGRFAPPSERAPDDAALDPVVMRSLEREPDKRFQQAREVRSEVEAAAGSPAGPAAAPPPPETAAAPPGSAAPPPPATRARSVTEIDASVIGWGDASRFALLAVFTWTPWLSHGGLGTSGWGASLYGIPAWTVVLAAALLFGLRIARRHGAVVERRFTVPLALLGTAYTGWMLVACASHQRLNAELGLWVTSLVFAAWTVIEVSEASHARRRPTHWRRRLAARRRAGRSGGAPGGA